MAHTAKFFKFLIDAPSPVRLPALPLFPTLPHLSLSLWAAGSKLGTAVLPFECHSLKVSTAS